MKELCKLYSSRQINGVIVKRKNEMQYKILAPLSFREKIQIIPDGLGRREE